MEFQVRWGVVKGKDTVGKIIQEFLPEFEIKKFADKLKDIICILIGCTREQLEDREFKEKELGVEWRLFKHNITGKIISPREMSIQHALHHGVRDSHYTQIDLTPRLMLQLLGTEAGRDIIHPNIWVNTLFADYTKRFTGKTFYGAGIGRVVQEYEYPNWIITDMRFSNELKAVEDRGGITIRVERDYVLRGGPEDPKDQHESETALDNVKFDYTIDNNGSIEDLIEKVREILIKKK